MIPDPTMEAADDSGTAGAPQAGFSALLRESSLYLAGNVASKFVGFVMIPFYAGFLSAEEYGVLNLLELATTIVAMAFGLQSIGQSLTRISHDQADARGRDGTASTALIGTAGVAATVAALASIFAGPIAAAASLNGQAGLLRLAFAAMVFSSIGEVALVHERMRGRARFYLAYSMVTLVATLSLNILLIGAAHLGVAGFVVSKLAVTLCGGFYLCVRVLREVGFVWNGRLAIALARFAAPLVVSGGAYLAIHFSDRLFLAHISRPDVGIYALAYNFAFLLSILIGDSFGKSWGVSFYGHASGQGWQDRFVEVGRWLIFVLGAGSVGISLFGRDMLTVMVPPSYYPPMLLLPVLVFGYFLREVGDFFNAMLLIGRGSGLVGRLAVLGAGLNIALNAMLIPRFGIWGAAWSTFATWGAYCAASWIAAWRLHRIALPPWPLALMLALSALCLWARQLGAPAHLTARLLLDGAAWAAFLACAGMLYLQGAERRAVWRVFHRLVIQTRIYARQIRLS